MSSIFDPPKPPNPIKVANAQAAANKETAIAEANLSNINQVTPEGSLTYSIIGTNADGTPKYQATQTYSPGQQAIYDQNTANALKASQTGGAQLNAVAGKLATPFTLSATPQQSNINLNQNLGLANNLNLDKSLDQQTALGLNQNLGLNTNKGLNTNLGLNQNLSYSGAPNIDDQAVSNRIYQLGAQRLDPRFAQEQQKFESDMANRGVVPGTEAYARAQQQFNQAKNDAYNQLALTAQDQAFQEQLARRNTSTSETNNIFNAANQARQANAEFANQAQGQNAQFANDAMAQNANFGNQARKENFEAYNAANLQNQNFANQNLLAQTQANNIATAQNAQFNNQAQQQQQQFNNAVLAANRDRATQDALLQRQTPLNEFSALMSGAQVQQPNYVNTPQPGVAPVDVTGIYAANAAAQANQYNAMLGGLGSIGGGLASTVSFSDRRMKKDIKKIGSLADGVGVYKFKYKPELLNDGGLQHIGVMAQEVEKSMPDAVVDTNSGFKAVDYGRVLEGIGA